MGYSRISKLVREVRGYDSLARAATARKAPINIVVGNGPTEKAARMAFTAVALALRCFDGPVRVSLPDPSQPGLEWKTGSLAHQLFEEGERYGAVDRLEVGTVKMCDVPTLAISTEGAGSFIADAAGWVASVGQTLPPNLPSVAPAETFATCCAFAKLFASSVLGINIGTDERWMFSLVDFTAFPPVLHEMELPHLDLGSVGLVGAGAIGSGYAFTLWLSGWSATVDVLDRDRYDEPNLETTMLISRSHTVELQPKAEVLAKLLESRPGLCAHGSRVEITQNSFELLKRRNMLICAVDNPETRRSLDGTNAELIINGAVGGTRLDSGHVLCSRHGVGDGALSTIYRERRFERTNEAFSLVPPLEAVDECSRVAYGNVSMAAPFISLASGALLLAASAQHALRRPANANYLKLDLFGLQAKIQRECR